MSFTLRIEFSGLCLYVVDPQGQRVAVLMPDARMSTNPSLFHLDGTDAEPHVGYLRLDLEDLGWYVQPGRTAAPPADPVEPRYELVHRFDRQVLALDGVSKREAHTVALAFPSFEQVAPGLELLPGLFGEAPPDALLMRMVLEGGTWSSTPTGETWEFSTLLNPYNAPFAGRFASVATWTREYVENELTVRVTDFAGAPQAELPMRQIPHGAVIDLKIANLCAENPLEWDDLMLRQVKGDDLDFKWLYRLLQPPQGATFATALNNQVLPVPRRTGVNAHTGADDCMGGKITSPVG